MLHSYTSVKSLTYLGSTKELLFYWWKKKRQKKMSLTCNHKDDGGRCQNAGDQVQELVEHVGFGDGRVPLGDHGGAAQQVGYVGHGGRSPSATLTQRNER